MTETPPNTGSDPREKVALPGMFLMITAGIVAFFQIIGLLIRMLGMGGAMMSDDSGVAALMSGTLGMVFGIIGLLLSGLIFYGGMKMRNLESWGLALAASIIAMIPCFTGLCCVIGLPVGIWSIVVLLDNDVKNAFR